MICRSFIQTFEHTNTIKWNKNCGTMLDLVRLCVGLFVMFSRIKYKNTHQSIRKGRFYLVVLSRTLLQQTDTRFFRLIHQSRAEIHWSVCWRTVIICLHVDWRETRWWKIMSRPKKNRFHLNHTKTSKCQLSGQKNGAVNLARDRKSPQ